MLLALALSAGPAHAQETPAPRQEVTQALEILSDLFRIERDHIVVLDGIVEAGDDYVSVVNGLVVVDGDRVDVLRGLVLVDGEYVTVMGIRVR